MSLIGCKSQDDWCVQFAIVVLLGLWEGAGTGRAGMARLSLFVLAELTSSQLATLYSWRSSSGNWSKKLSSRAAVLHSSVQASARTSRAPVRAALRIFVDV